MEILEVTAPLILSLSLGQTVDMSDVEIRAVAPMDCVVKICAEADQALEASVKLGIVNGADQAQNGLCIDSVSDSIIEVRAIRGAISNGFQLIQTGEYGIFNNFIRVGSIRHNGANGMIVMSPTGGALGVQGNHIEIGQIIHNKHSGIAIFGKESAWNYFQVGPVEWNGMFGIYNAGRENIFVVPNTNSNGIFGMVKGDKDIVIGQFSDGVK